MLEMQLCPECGSSELNKHSYYMTQHNGQRCLWRCVVCQEIFSDTRNSALFRLQNPVSKVAAVLKVRSEGLGLRATARVFGLHKNTISHWEENFAQLKPTLKLYLLCHHFISLCFEADEVYTRVHHNRPAHESPGWTIILLERASRFILDAACGQKESQDFEAIIQEMLKLHCDGLSLFSDGERRYSSVLFSLCWERAHQKGHPKVLKKGVEVALKNKGSKQPKRAKYEHPVRHHAKTPLSENSEIHGNHLEAFNASLRRRNSAFRRRTNTYAKDTVALQRTLDVHWLIHNFVRPHFTTGIVPAVALGILNTGFSIEQSLAMRRFQ